jgi:sortase A
VKPLSLARSVVGATMLWASAAGAGYSIAWTLRSHATGDALVHSGQARLSDTKAYDAAAGCRAGTPAVGQIAGLLKVPALSLTAPVEQGETDAVLSAAVGHDVSSVWPGQDGTTVLAAHDVSYFARIGTLRPGDLVVYVSACRTTTYRVTGHRIVPSGSPVADTATPTLVLDTCWPNNALWWTPDRELVTAVEISSHPNASAEPLAGRGAAGDRSSSNAGNAPIGVPAPPALVAQGLTLDTNPTLLGTMQVTGHPSSAFVQSPEPLDVEQAALTAYYGTLHALAAGRQDWFAAVAPHVRFPGSLAGSRVTQYLTRLTISIEASGSKPSVAVLMATVTLTAPSGATTDGNLVVSCVIRGGELVVSGWRFSP